MYLKVVLNGVKLQIQPDFTDWTFRAESDSQVPSGGFTLLVDDVTH